MLSFSQKIPKKVSRSIKKALKIRTLITNGADEGN